MAIRAPDGAKQAKHLKNVKIVYSAVVFFISGQNNAMYSNSMIVSDVLFLEILPWRRTLCPREVVSTKYRALCL